MTVYVAEISGRGIVAFDATSDDEARARLADKTLQRDLHVFQNGGRTLWDGVSEIYLRGALPNEAETWQASRAMAGRAGGSGDQEHGHVFLIPVVDPSNSMTTTTTMMMTTRRLNNRLESPGDPTAAPMPAVFAPPASGPQPGGSPTCFSRLEKCALGIVQERPRRALPTARRATSSTRLGGARRVAIPSTRSNTL